MHRFTELIDRSTALTLESLREINEKTTKALETSGATVLVKTLQMIQLQKAILAVGMFAVFEANLQDGFKCTNGFDEAKKVLDQEAEGALKARFEDFYRAINVLKHGQGRSYKSCWPRSGACPSG